MCQLKMWLWPLFLHYCNCSSLSLCSHACLDIFAILVWGILPFWPVAICEDPICLLPPFDLQLFVTHAVVVGAFLHKEWGGWAYGLAHFTIFLNRAVWMVCACLGRYNERSPPPTNLAALSSLILLSSALKDAHSSSPPFKVPFILCSDKAGLH